MSINGILSSALSALQTNTAALRVVSNNVSNLNTPGYARRVANEATQSAGGQLTGVELSDIQRVVDQYQTQQVLSAGAGSSQYGAQNTLFMQLNSLLGQPGDGTSLGSQLDDVFSALSSASLSPNSSASQQAVLNSMQGLASTISTTASNLSNLQQQTDSQIGSSISTVNSTIQSIYQLNQQIQNSNLSGDDSSGLLDQRDEAIQNLSQYIGVKTVQQPNGGVTVMTDDGTSLVGDSYAQISYSPGGTNGTYGSIQLTNINGASGQPIGPAQDLDSHIDSGSLKGLLDMRDNQLPQLMSELGTFAQQTALAFNSVSNANSAYPPASSLEGRDTGLLDTDSLNFSGKTTIAVTDSSGNLTSRIDVDFTNGTLSVDGGGSVSIDSTIGSFTSALNSALSSNGTASFANGQLTISASGSDGVAIQDDATTPSSRGGAGFSQFFGLNDVFQSAAPSILTTGLSASDASGLAAGSAMSFALKNADGGVDKTATVTITAGMSIGDVINALNTSFNGAATFNLKSSGQLAMTPSAANAGDSLNVASDTTSRGATGVSFTELFGLGINQQAAQAQGFSVTSAISSGANGLPFAQPNITSTTVAGDQIVGSGDASGLVAFQNLANKALSIPASGGLAAQTSSLSDYAANFYQDVATRSDQVDSNNTTQSDRLTEAQSQQASTSGVNLDEELSNMVIYQQAYSAGARMLQVGQQLYDTLLQMPT